MTEAEWLACEDPRRMLEFLRGRASERKVRLFAVACSRQVWDLLTDDSFRRATEVAERYADGQASPDELLSASEEAVRVFYAPFRTGGEPIRGAVNRSAHCRNSIAKIAAAPGMQVYDFLFRSMGDGVESAVLRDEPEEGRRRCETLRDIVNSFRPVPLDPAWLAWDGGTAPKLARVIYDERAFDRMPVLADALEDAGCADHDLLGHLRGPGPHVRGCWVVDLLLGRE